MAITALVPSHVDANLLVTEKNERTALRVVPSLGTKKRVEHKYFVAFVTLVGIVGLLMLLVINTLLAQNAFKLHRLQLQVQSLSDQREAVVREITLASSPEQLATHAQGLGMIASQSPRFLTLIAAPTVLPQAKG